MRPAETLRHCPFPAFLPVPVRLLGLALALLSSSLALATPKPSGHPTHLTRPKLVLVLVIDQFRADYLSRFENKFLPAHQKNGDLGGFRYLMAESAYFPFAQYDILQSITAPGHATIATGSYPYLSGITHNDWYSNKLQRSEYCVEDPTSPLVRSPGIQGPNLETHGRSPKNLNGSTFSDELKNLLPQARVVTVSLKDRAAILLGGRRADLALWFDTHTRTWASSQYYLKDKGLPEWINQLNVQTATALNSATPPAIDVRDLDSDPNYRSQGTDLTALAAEKALHAYHLGKGPQTDYLAVSFSTHDIVGHHLGPYHPEMEKLTLSEDRAFSRLLNAVQKAVPGGLKNVLIAFSADHGVAPSPEWARENRFDSGRIDERDLREKISTRLNEKFGKPTRGNWITTSLALNFYLNHPAILEKGLDAKLMEDEIKRVLLETEGILFAFTRTEYHQKRLPPGLLERQIQHTYYLAHSGDVVGILKPFFISGRKDAPPGTSSHITGYAYDRSVPLLIRGNYVKPGIYSTRAEVIDLAPTLAFLLGTLPPALSEGRVLSEALSLQ